MGILALTVVLIVSVLSLAPNQAKAQEFSSLTPLEQLAVTATTGEKPQSKVWTYDSYWWTVMPNATGTKLFRLDGTSWTSVLNISGATDSQADVQVAGNIVHILLFRGTSSELVSVEYLSASHTYQLWTTRPTLVPITLDSGVETATIDIDSNGRMWLASDGTTNINVRWSDSPYSSWSSPITLANNVSLDDICDVIAFDGKVGVLWSNQNTQRFGFRVHVDGFAPATWSGDEVPASQSALNIGAGMADDHLNVAASSDGTLYASVKTSYDTGGYPMLALLVRRPAGTWDDLYEINGSGTRPIALLNQVKGILTVVYSSTDGPGNIDYKQTYLSPINFGPEHTLISGSHNNPTSTKQNVTGRVVILAANGGSAAGVIADATLDLQDSLVARWAMDEGSGTILVDSSPLLNNGTISGAPSWVTGINGQALDLSGSGQFAQVPSNSSLSITNMITLAAWIRPDVRGTQRIIKKSNASSGYELFLEGPSPYRVSVRFNNTIRVNSTTAYPIDGTWMHVAATWDGTIIRLYINGVEEASLSSSTSIVANSDNLGVGATLPGSDYFNGRLDDLYIFHRALSAGEVTTLATIPAVTHTITASAGPNGSISPSGAVSVIDGGSQMFTMTSNIGYHIADVLVDGGSVGTPPTYTFTNVTTDHTISVSFAQDVAQMVGHWPMNEGSGTNLVDSSGLGNNASIFGVPDWASGVRSLAFLFDGSTDYATVPDNASLDITQAITLAAWVRPGVQNTQYIMRKSLMNTTDGYELSLSSTGRFFIRFNQASSTNTFRLDSKTIYPSNGTTWAHIAATYDGATIRMYVNGVLDTSLATVVTIAANSLNLAIGAQPDGSSKFTGAIHDARIYNYALGASEVLALSQHRIVASAGSNGAISPTGNVIVNHGVNQAFSITSGTGYHVADVLVDGISVGAVSSYTFNTVSTDHTIAASFAIDTYTIAASAGAGGSIAPSGNVIVNYGADQLFNITANAHYHIADVLVDGVSVGAVSSYNFPAVAANHTIVASFAIDTYTIASSAGAGGLIAPSGNVIVNYGADQLFSITANAHYHIADVLVDGVSVGAVSSYNFPAVAANHTIVASFAIDTYTIASSAGAGGLIAPSGNVIVNYGADQLFSITANAHYHIADVLVDGVSVGSGKQVTISPLLPRITQSWPVSQSTLIQLRPAPGQAVQFLHRVNAETYGPTSYSTLLLMLIIISPMSLLMVFLWER